MKTLVNMTVALAVQALVALFAFKLIPGVTVTSEIAPVLVWVLSKYFLLLCLVLLGGLSWELVCRSMGSNASDQFKHLRSKYGDRLIAFAFMIPITILDMYSMYFVSANLSAVKFADFGAFIFAFALCFAAEEIKDRLLERLG